jgi:hypothetical protein
MQYTETELAKLIETVEQEFTTHLNKAEVAHSAALAKSEVSASGTLAKAEDSKPPKKEESAPKEEKESNPSESEAAPEEHNQAPNMEAEAEQPAAPAPAAAAAGHGYDDEDMAHMLKMYQSMSREELLAHHDCVRQCLDAMGGEQAPAEPGLDKCGPMSMGKSEIEDENPVLNSKPKAGGENMNNDKKNGGIEKAPPHDAPGAKSAASNANGAKINKSEHDRRNGGKIEGQAPGKIPGAKSPASKAEGMQMEKSENMEIELLKSELEAEKASNAELKKSFDKATEILTTLVKKVVPQGKAITELAVIEKSEGNEEVKELSKSEVTQILMKKDQTKLTPADREAINSFYLGSSDLKTISHLLKN